VVGLLAAALWTPVWTSAVARPLDVAVVALGFALLMTGRVPPIAVVALCAVLGEAM
jgi:chromate transporter